MTREEAINKWIIPSIKNTWNAKKCKEILEALEQEPCKDCISRKSIKQKLQEHHDFFVNAYGGFSNLSQNDKSRVDEITNCIAMVVNEPSVTPQEPRKGHWFVDERPESNREVICSNCEQPIFKYHKLDFDYRPKFCPNCGSDNREVEE